MNEKNPQGIKKGFGHYVRRYAFAAGAAVLMAVLVIFFPEIRIGGETRAFGSAALTITLSSFREMLFVLPPIFVMLGLLDVWVPRLVGETLGLLDRGYDAGLKSMQSIGYRHMSEFLQQRLVWAEALRTMQRDTRRYAKRQQTWFGADLSIHWTAPRDLDRMRRLIDAFLE